ncbi:MAG: hypothetical protein KAJ81_09010, partial [Candidatus Latescibacteria bacterium]|nr:hypothetical protein [Candidatus Latescibacterota bacterium]
CPVRDRIFIAFEMPITLPKSREGRNRRVKDIMTKGAFGRILNEYAVPAGLEIFFLNCFAIAVLSLTGQNKTCE